MGTTDKHIVRFWRGTRESYNIIKDAKMLDYWTRYSVKEPSGMWSEFYGDNQISVATGQLLPVIDIVSGLEKITTELHPGDRYLVGKDAPDNGGTAEYYIVEVGVSQDNTGDWVKNTVIKPFDDKYSVRVRSKGLMSYQIVDGVLKTYDQVDCGTY